METYQRLKTEHAKDYQRLSKKYNLISLLRLLISLLLIFLVYKYFKSSKILYMFFSVLTVLCFVGLMKLHDIIAWNRKIQQTLIKINEDEINYLKGVAMPSSDGSEYIDAKHFYSFDLDFFGKNSLFQNLNRTATFVGSTKLAGLLLNLQKNKTILANQQAIKELSEKIEFRQQFLCIAKLANEQKEDYIKLIDWAQCKPSKTNFLLKIAIVASPILLGSLIAAYYIFDKLSFIYMAFDMFLVNLFLTIGQLKKIKNELIGSENIAKTIGKYGLIIQQIESENFKSEKLINLQSRLCSISALAGTQLKKLSNLFSKLEGIQNLAGAVIFNGAMLYHLSILNELYNWKKKYSKHIQEWLAIVGELEALNSLANFSYNNPNFVFPAINENYQIVFEDLGHPLISSAKRVGNNIAFQKSNFIILTGSNMSGKITFLRALGVNMVLAGMGAPVCAKSASLHPLNVLISMRQSDSLDTGESYFFAEIKRLKVIIEKLQNEICFVLLDKILKGTNSDDKQTGTIEIIKKIISKNAIGCVATHDLEVCHITKYYENKVYNKCFEVEIINDDLSFDYKLQNGVCKNKSATFLMKKLEIV